MEMKMKTLVLLLLLGLCISPSFADLRLPTNARFPRAQAERLIKELNLIPGIAEPEEEYDDGPRLVERSINFDINGDSEATAGLEELGHHAGYFRLEHTHAAKMFYFFFESRGSKADDPVVLWMTGGPGCSSELAVFYENGPFKITDNLTLAWNEYGWDKASNLIFVDQPTGTGFSYSTDVRDLRHDEKGVSNDMYDFLQAFFKEHPEYAKNDFFITGESYAGHYIPAVTSRVHQGNKDSEGLPINLKGFAIGNGLTDPAIQYKAYTDYALEMGLIGEDDYNRINKIYPACELSIKLCGTKGTVSCFASYLVCNSIFNSIMAIAGNINHYDVRKECNGGLCYDFSNMENYLNQGSVRDALGVGSRKFVSCSPLVYEVMLTDWMRNMEVGIPTLLDDGVKLLVYAGEYDLICNWLGNSRWVNSMDWSGSENFKQASTKSFLVDDKEAGLITSYGSLSFLKVHDAGHMVPMDQPKAALEMLKRWTQGSITDDNSQILKTVTEMPEKSFQS
jgi:serine carboxypeptidase-like clade 4